jgi:uncharacterized membrane protein
MELWLWELLTLIASVGCGLVAGIFFAFSNFVMPALGRVRPEAGLAAMQTINLTVLNPLFFLVFGGSGVLSLVLGWYGLWGAQVVSPWLVTGSLVYLVGCFLVTGLGNVPLNEALARLDADSPGAVEPWRRFVARWSLWNHVRTVAALGACVGFLVGRP